MEFNELFSHSKSPQECEYWFGGEEKPIKFYLLIALGCISRQDLSRYLVRLTFQIKNHGGQTQHRDPDSDRLQDLRIKVSVYFSFSIQCLAHHQQSTQDAGVDVVLLFVPCSISFPVYLSSETPSRECLFHLISLVQEISILTAEFLFLALGVTFKIISHEHFTDHPQSSTFTIMNAVLISLHSLLSSQEYSGGRVCHAEKKLASLSVYVCQVQCYCSTPIIKIKSFSCTQMILLKLLKEELLGQ